LERKIRRDGKAHAQQVAIFDKQPGVLGKAPDAARSGRAAWPLAGETAGESGDGGLRAGSSGCWRSWSTLRIFIHFNRRGQTSMKDKRVIGGLLWLALSAAKGNAQIASPQAAAEAASSTTPKTTEQVYKNIKVLKGVPADQLMPAMQFINASLGQRCDFCHAEGHFDKKPKETARKMMAMMFAINKDNFDNERKVTCYSCHQGASKPEGTPVVAEESAKSTMVEPPPATKIDLSKLPSASDLIDKYVQAAGGVDAIGAISSREEKGTVTGFGGRRFPIEIFNQVPNKGAVLTHYPNGQSLVVYDGHEGWISLSGRPTRAVEGADLEAAKIDNDLHLATDLKHLFREFKPAPPEKIQDHEAYQILGLTDGQPAVELYFDEQSGLLVRQVRYAQSPLGLYPTRIDYADYRDHDGVKIPFRVTTTHPGSGSVLEVEQVRQNVRIDDAKFAKPASPASSEKK
jgi:photosynthetic reaction center cytochrome c subunit